MRALLPFKQLAPKQGVQSPARMQPAAYVHLPDAQTLQDVAPKSPVQLPAGQGEHVAAPVTVP